MLYIDCCVPVGVFISTVCLRFLRCVFMLSPLCVYVFSAVCLWQEIPLVSASRYLVKQGELTRVVSDTASRIPFGKAFRGPAKHTIWLFLFNDILLVAKKKGWVGLHVLRDRPWWTSGCALAHSTIRFHTTLILMVLKQIEFYYTF